MLGGVGFIYTECGDALYMLSRVGVVYVEWGRGIYDEWGLYELKGVYMWQVVCSVYMVSRMGYIYVECDVGLYIFRGLELIIVSGMMKHQYKNEIFTICISG